MGKCKIMEKCRPCRCGEKQAVGLSEKMAAHRPAERIIERRIMELAGCGKECQCNKEAGNAGENP